MKAWKPIFSGSWRHCVSAFVAAATLIMAVRAAAALPPPDVLPAEGGEIMVQPLQHATLGLRWKEHTVLVDPVGGAALFTNLPRPTLVLLTDIHGDHYQLSTLQALLTEKTLLVAPPAVTAQLPEALRSRTTTLTNGQSAVVGGVAVEAIAAYNLAEERQKFHPKGRGNGYVITLGGKRVYVSGDTEDIPEMRALQKIDVAFLCMNLPYTMTVEQAAEAVKAFRPRIVYPYHSRGSDLNRFKELLAGEKDVEVRLRNWYATAGR
ncbi:MAG: MBL fold metallo-hydrolase [Verrucomicrobiae bacterium]|nr:MBL fold metallo-hydrolase [Verrucomicrobiae bacterium]